MKAAAKSVEEIAEKRVKSLVSSKGVTAVARVTADGTLEINVKGRPSGKVDGRHGDHVIAQILPIHGIRRAAHGTKVGDIDDLRDVRESIFNFISSIAVLNGSRNRAGMKVSAASEDAGEEVLANSSYVVNNSALDGLYARINEILDEYNKRRYQETKLHILEKTFNAVITNQVQVDAQLNFATKEQDVITVFGGLKEIYDAHIAQNRESNRYLICETFERLIEATSTYYYQIPNTAFPVIPGYEASESEGGNVVATLSRLDAICERLEEARKSETSSGRAKRSSTMKDLTYIAKEMAQGELSYKEKEFSLLNSKFSRTEDEERRVQSLSGRIEKLAAFSASNADPLRYIALQLKDLFHYPEITMMLDPVITGTRTNDPEEFHNQVAKHLFTAFNVYPELAQDYDDKNRIVRLFINEVINHVTDLGAPQGWASLQRMDVGEHMVAVNIRLNELDMTKADNLYTNTVDYRSRASSGAMEDIKAWIINPAIVFIRKNFGLEEDYITSLEHKLGELTLDVDERTFRQEIIKSVQRYCRPFDVAPEEIQKLQHLLLFNKEQERKVGGVL